MKKIHLLICFIAISISVSAQNVGIGTATPAGKLHIQGTADATQFIIDANSTQSNTNPFIKLRNSSGTDLMWLHSDNINNTFIGLDAGRVNNAGGGGIYNTFIGSGAGYSNTSGYDNTANGYSALYSNTIGFNNTANGNFALYFNTIGNKNTAYGNYALYSNTQASQNTAIGNAALTVQSYNPGSPWNSDNVAVGYAALNSNQPTSINNGIENTAIGNFALRANTTGYSNTANGYAALFSNTSGFHNTATGQGALYFNTAGYENTANGYGALASNTTGTYNTAIGYKALYSQSYSPGSAWASFNVAVGYYALYSNQPTSTANGYSNTAIGNLALTDNTIGLANTAIGTSALQDNSIGRYNTAIGYNTLWNNTMGDGNSALGYLAGPNTTNLSNTTCIGNGATATANNQMVLGNANVTEFYSYGAYVGTTAFAANLTVLNTGQIVRSTSSRRYKKDIEPIDINTANIYKLKPVSYNSYTDDSRHFGLIAEEVAEIIPELAMYSKEKDVVKGSTSEKMIPDAVQYPLLSVLILKEVQKHEQTIMEQQKIIDGMKKEIEELKKLIKAAN